MLLNLELYYLQTIHKPSFSQFIYARVWGLIYPLASRENLWSSFPYSVSTPKFSYLSMVLPMGTKTERVQFKFENTSVPMG